jgi:hypothetical protein
MAGRGRDQRGRADPGAGRCRTVPRAAPADIAAITAALEAKVPGARVDAQSDWLRPVYRALAALQWLALG